VRSTFDGVSVAVVPLGTNPATYTVTGSFHIGKEAAESRLATGRADDIRVYDRILTPDEIKAYYDLSLRGYPGLLARSHEFIGKRAAVAAGGASRHGRLLLGERNHHVYPLR
jgi:hypothetical protein